MPVDNFKGDRNVPRLCRSSVELPYYAPFGQYIMPVAVVYPGQPGLRLGLGGGTFVCLLAPS